MASIVDYYMTPVSPWAYFGHDRWVAICAPHGATIRLNGEPFWGQDRLDFLARKLAQWRAFEAPPGYSGRRPNAGNARASGETPPTPRPTDRAQAQPPSSAVSCHSMG
jgi:hypothetical protein